MKHTEKMENEERALEEVTVCETFKKDQDDEIKKKKERQVNLVIRHKNTQAEN